MTTSFNGKTVIITGATSGIGEATAALLARQGATVIATGRRADALSAAAARHPEITWVLSDLEKEGDARKPVDEALRLSKRLDVVINNAGISLPSPLESAPPEAVARQFTVNVLGLSATTQAALAALKESRGSVINISSAAGHKAAAGISHYGATKAAVESLTRSWAVELAPFGVRVNAIAPGPVETAIFAKMGMSGEAVAGFKEQLKTALPLGRMAQPEEIAHWIVALADPSVTWVTGQVLSIDGGMSLV